MASEFQSQVKSNKRWIGVQVILISLFALTIVSCSAGDFMAGQLEPQSALAQASSGEALGGVEIQAASGATIEFKSNNGEASLLDQSQDRQLPYLVLFRNGQLTDPVERTLVVTLNNLEVPPSGLTITLLFETQHSDPDQGGLSSQRIPVWQGSRYIANATGETQFGMVQEFAIEIPGTIQSGGAEITTPTDYYRLDLVVTEGAAPDGRVIQTLTLDEAFLVERQEVLSLVDSAGSASQPGPSQFVIYYADMFPFQGSISNRLPRAQVPAFVQTLLGPAMVEAVRLQTLDWGFSWSQAWMSDRGPDASHLDVVLSDGQTWFHFKAPDRGHSGIAINVNGGNNAEYDTLIDGLMSTFHHELFHNLQRSLALQVSGDPTLNGVGDAWQFFTEGTASFVPTVAQPHIQFAQSDQPRAYIAKAIEYIGGKGFPGELNQSYRQMNPYNAALFWRFLFEKCGGMAGTPEGTRQGMGVIRTALEVLYSKQVVDVSQSDDLVGSLPVIFDRALSNPQAGSCPFHTYNDSLVAFSQSIYALRLDRNACPAAGIPGECGFYDPQGLYSSPIVDQINYSGSEMQYAASDQAYPSGVPNSFGSDYIEIPLHSGLGGKPLTIEFHADPHGSAVFSVQVWMLYEVKGGGFSRSLPQPVAAPHSFVVQADGTPQIFVIPTLDTTAYNTLGLIIQRLDANEAFDSTGAYTLILK